MASGARAGDAALCAGAVATLRAAVRPARVKRRFVFAQRLAGVRASHAPRPASGVPAHDDLAAGVAAFGPEIDDPVGGADHVEVVLDDDQRMAGREQLAERAQQLRDVVEVQAGGRLVEQEQRCRGLRRRVSSAARALRRDGPRASAAALRRPTASAPAARAAGIRGPRRPAAAARAARRASPRRTPAPRRPSCRARRRCSRVPSAPSRRLRASRRDSACRRSPGSAGTRRRGTASRRARSHCRCRSGSGRCRS